MRQLQTDAAKWLKPIILRDWNLEIDVDMILRAQAADPAVLRARSPHLITFARRALEQGRPLLEPVVAYHQFHVVGMRHGKMILEAGILSGQVVSQHLSMAEQIVVMVVTIGEKIERLVSELMNEDWPYALAMDGLGSAAVEALAAAACRHFEERAEAEGLKTTVPFSPGMMGWPADEGQRQIFGLVDAAQAGVRLTEGWMMVPRKSASAVVGIGKNIGQQGKPCDYCIMSKNCRYRQQYSP
jgi:hypothetical protein